jgi:DNA-binding MarR family transcriptional regulator
MKQQEKEFYDAFTGLQCFILANMNKGDIKGVTATHYNTIEFIYRNDGITGKELSEAFNVSAAAISKQLKFLIANNFIRQTPGLFDRRVINLSVTENGKFIIDNSENFRESVSKKVAEILTKPELKHLTDLLNKALKKL